MIVRYGQLTGVEMVSCSLMSWTLERVVGGGVPVKCSEKYVVVGDRTWVAPLG